MPRRDTPKPCPKHVNPANGYDRSEINQISELMDGLPDNQGFPGRHKCAYCGFTAGFDLGYEAALTEAVGQLRSLKNQPSRPGVD